MERFERTAFLKAGGTVRMTLCKELAESLSMRLRSHSDFHRGVKALVLELRALGHDLWSFDESDELEVWCPNYQTPSEPGIVVTFAPDSVTVEWSEQ